MERKLVECAKILRKAEKIAVLTGAGISTESGIPDFRSPNGLWQKREAREATTRSCFFYDVDTFYHYFAQLFLGWTGIKPNPAHIALAALEHELGKLVFIVTQNIDGLHQMAGSTNVAELHGNLRTATCPKCQKQYDMIMVREALAAKQQPLCECGRVVKPDVVLFEDPLDPYTWRQAQVWTMKADVVLCVGTSLTVSPANTLVYNRRNDSTLVILNTEPTRYDSQADFVFREKAGEVLSRMLSICRQQE
ncbi:MAG: NAD-dependent deacylase [Heliobacteriaceae bacterium]|nr:NAD-dependent deacylase [Heliobacteriaceae bacterium]